ncbi:MAG: hypothetical protein ACOCWA_03970 [Bacteroidota bacterium]
MKSSVYFFIAVALVILLPLAGHLAWRIQKKNPLDLMIVNKTVLQSSENEVKSLNWVLNYRKVIKNDRQNYDFEKDYFGFHPDAISTDRTIRSFGIDDLSDIKEKYDGLFYLDNKGVELDHQKYANLKYYGGFNNTDFLLLKEMMNNEKLVVVEYNFFSEPTEELIRYNTEQLMDIYSLHWKGKYFKDLSEKKAGKELEEKWFECYKNYSGKEWDYTGPGLILCNLKQDRIIILPKEEYLIDSPVITTTEKTKDQYKLPAEVKYSGWFDIIYEGNNEVISTISLNLNPKGIDFLKQNGLEGSFPASVKMKGKPVYYLAGDFSKQKVFLPFSKMRIINDLYRGICNTMTGNPHVFFQTYYVPFMSGIILDYYDVTSHKEKT